MKFLRVSVVLFLAAVLGSACDCGGDGKKESCDCQPTVTFTSPSGSATLTEFHDSRPNEEGVQYPVKVRTTCIPADAVLTLSNSLRPTEKVFGKVVLDDVPTQYGHIEYGDQTFVEGSNRVCILGGFDVDRTEKGSSTCTKTLGSVDECKDVVVQYGVAACRFETPLDGQTLAAKDDSSASLGFQHDVRVVCKGVSDGQEVRLIVNKRELKPVRGALASQQVLFEDVDLAEGTNTLLAETGPADKKISTEIGVTVDSGGCALRLLPPDGTVLRGADDKDPNVPQLQLNVTVETDSGGTFSCADGSAISIFAGGQEYKGTLVEKKATMMVTFGDGTAVVYATVKEPGASGRSGRSQANSYFVCATPIAIEITAPRDEDVIDDRADRDPAKAGIQVAVTGGSVGIPLAENLQLMIDGLVILDAGEPLRPASFFPGGTFEFRFASLLLSKAYSIQVTGANACEEQGSSLVHTVTVQTQQRTCVIADPVDGAILNASVDLDHNEANDLQYGVRVLGGNVSNGSTFTLFISGQDPLSGLQMVGGQSVNEVTFKDGEHDLQCVLGTGESSPVNAVTVDGHSPVVEILSPADGATLDRLDLTVELTASGAEDGAIANVCVDEVGGTLSSCVGCTVTDGGAFCKVTLFGGAGVKIENKLTVTVNDAAGNDGSASVTVFSQVPNDPPVLTFFDPDPSAGEPVQMAENARIYTVIVRVENMKDMKTGDPVTLTVVDNGYPRAPRIAPLSGSGFATFVDVVLPRGDVELQARATNSIGTGTKKMRLFVGLAGMPVVVVTAPADGSATRDSALLVSVDSNVEAGQTCYICANAVEALKLPPDCTAGIAKAEGPADGNGDLTATVNIGEGGWNLWATCTNQAGNTTTSVSNRIFVDQTAPTVSLSEPPAGALFNALSPDRSSQLGFQIRVRGTADVEAGQGATVLVDGTPAEIIGPPPTFISGQITFPAVTVTDQARHELTLEACDQAGNCGTSPPVSITVDRLAPDVTITDPVNAAKLGATSDTDPGGTGFQIDVRCAFVNASAGDIVELERNVDSGGWEAVGSHTLSGGELGSYVFGNTTVIPDDRPNATVQLRARVRDVVNNVDVDEVSIIVARLAPEVVISRPTNGANMNIFSDGSPDPGLQTQVNIDTQNTLSGDLLVLCVSPGTGYPPGHCSTHGNEVWVGQVTGAVTPVLGVTLGQGDNKLVAFSENIPGQGTYSPEVLVHVDSIPPTVTSFDVTSDANDNGCLSQAEGSFQASVAITGAEDGQVVTLMRNWPPGSSIGTATVAGGVASFAFSLADGDYNLTATVTDRFGNPNIRDASPVILDPEAQLLLRVDSQPPTIAITSPNKAVLNSSDDLTPATQDLDFNFAAATNAESGQAVLFEVDGSSVGTAGVLGGAALLAATMGQGGRNLRASVSDSCGNPAVPATLAVTVDTIKPTVSCSSPTDNSTFNTQDVPFVCTTTGTDSTQKFRIVSSLTGVLPCQPNLDTSGTTSFNCRMIEGKRDLTVTVTDPAGNVSDSFEISNVEVDITGCSIGFVGQSGIVTFNASNDKDGNPGNGLQIDLQACSPSPECVGCTNCVTLKKNGTPIGSVQGLDAGGCTTFVGVQFTDGEAGTDMQVELEDDAHNVSSDQLTVELVDLYPPTVARLIPGNPANNSFACVASTGNPTVDGLTVIADKIAGEPCDMDFQFVVTGGGDAAYPGTFAVRLGAGNIAGPYNIDTSPKTIDPAGPFAVQLPNNATHTVVAVARDFAGNEATISMTVEVDVVAPGAITATAALGATLQASRHADVRLDWTAVGDDGTSAASNATAYAIRWVDSNYKADQGILDETDWQVATEVPNSVAPKVAGGGETFLAQWLPPLNKYHLAIRAVDEVGNLGPIPADLTLNNMWTLVSYTGIGGIFGSNAWNIGDVNNDGFEDLAVSAATMNSNQGMLYVFYGESNLANWGGASLPQQLKRGIPGELFSFDIGVRGDLDGDNIPDLAVSGRSFESNRGRVSIYFGRNGGQLPNDPDMEIRPPTATATGVGRSVEILGDINNDGYDDLFVSAPIADSNGRGYIFFGRPRTCVLPQTGCWTDTVNYATGLDLDNIPYVPVSKADVKILGESSLDWFGYRHGATTLGDLNNDGYTDFALVASGVNKLYTYDGATISGITGRDVAARGDAVDMISYGSAYTDGGYRSGFGIRAAGGRDLTGDGKLDLVVTSAFFRQAFLFAGISAAQPSVKIDPVFTKQIAWPEASASYFGYDLDVGDVNLDGRPDMLIGMNSTVVGNRAFVFFNTGTTPFFSDIPGITLRGPDGSGFGAGVGVGDFNKDGLPDIAVGSFAGNGILYVYY